MTKQWDLADGFYESLWLLRKYYAPTNSDQMYIQMSELWGLDEINEAKIMDMIGFKIKDSKTRKCRVWKIPKNHAAISKCYIGIS